MRYVVAVILLFVSPFSFASNGKQAPDFNFSVDGQMQQYELVGMPSSYLIDRDGTIRFSHKGFFSAKQGAYEQQIIALLQESE